MVQAALVRRMGGWSTRVATAMIAERGRGPSRSARTARIASTGPGAEAVRVRGRNSIAWPGAGRMPNRALVPPISPSRTGNANIEPFRFLILARPGTGRRTRGGLRRRFRGQCSPSRLAGRQLVPEKVPIGRPSAHAARQRRNSAGECRRREALVDPSPTRIERPARALTVSKPCSSVRSSPMKIGRRPR